MALLCIHLSLLIASFSMARRCPASASGCGIELKVDEIPFLPGAKEYAQKGTFAGGAFDNQHFYNPHVDFVQVPEFLRMLLFDPQTSGGLLIAVDETSWDQLNQKRDSHQMFLKIGRVVQGNKILVS